MIMPGHCDAYHIWLLIPFFALFSSWRLHRADYSDAETGNCRTASSFRQMIVSRVCPDGQAVMTRGGSVVVGRRRPERLPWTRCMQVASYAMSAC